MTGAELAGRLEKLAESWTAASAACLRISDADAGHTNGLVAQGEANALRDCAQDLRAALAALPPPAAGDARAEVELAAREKMREFINAMADEYAHEHFICDPTTGVWEAGNETKESYELGLRDAAGAIARLNCEKFGHDWRRWNDITRRCYRCEIQEHGEHLRTALAQGQTDG